MFQESFTASSQVNNLYIVTHTEKYSTEYRVYTTEYTSAVIHYLEGCYTCYATPPIITNMRQ